jgi:agmatine deiminase
MAPHPAPASNGLAMPPEWSPHERTYMGWPCRRELWGASLADAKEQYAGVANVVAAFEPLAMVCATPQDATEARAALSGEVEILELPADDSWLRDTGPMFLVDEGRSRRAGVHFGFNAWGGKFEGYAADAALGARLVEHAGDELFTAPFVLEGGAILVDGAGVLLTTEQCLLHPNRNPSWTREDLEQGLRDFLGVRQVVWLGDGLVEDRDTDGHVDMFAAFTGPGRVLLQSAPPGHPDHLAMADNRARAIAADLEVVDFPVPPAPASVGGREIGMAYLNLYLSDRFAIMPTAGAPSDEEAEARVAAALPEHEVIAVPGATIAFGGGGPHCITQQVPKLG